MGEHGQHHAQVLAHLAQAAVAGRSGFHLEKFGVYVVAQQLVQAPLQQFGAAVRADQPEQQALELPVLPDGLGFQSRQAQFQQWQPLPRR